MSVKITDHSDVVKEEFEKAMIRALTKCGMTAEGYAKKLCPVDTGNLRNSITHAVAEGEETVYIGTNVEYAPYIEFGTGEYAAGGRPTPWVYQDANGNWHYTRGNRAHPFLKPAVADHKDKYQKIISDEFKGI